MCELKKGDRVVREDGLTGTVIAPGPYGDDPHQVRDENGGHHSFIKDDGTSGASQHVWKVKTMDKAEMVDEIQARWKVTKALMDEGLALQKTVADMTAYAAAGDEDLMDGPRVLRQIVERIDMITHEEAKRHLREANRKENDKLC